MRRPGGALGVRIGPHGGFLWKALRQLSEYCPRSRLQFAADRLRFESEGAGPLRLSLGVSPALGCYLGPGAQPDETAEALILLAGDLDRLELDELEQRWEPGSIWALGVREYSLAQERRWRGRQRLLDLWDAEPEVACRTVASELAGLRVGVLVYPDLFSPISMPLPHNISEGGWTLGDFQQAVGLLQPLKVVALSVSGCRELEISGASERGVRPVQTAAEAVRAALTAWW